MKNMSKQRKRAIRMEGKRNKEREGGGTHASERTALKLRDS